MSRADFYANRKIYRALHTAEDLQYFHIQEGETDLHIGACSSLPQIALAAAKEGRKQIQATIDARPEFLTSLQPIPSLGGESPLINKMMKAAQLAQVGPMAAVAGALAEYVGQALLPYSDQVIVENGGDLFLYGPGSRSVAVWAGNSPLSGHIGVQVPTDKGCGVCTSSGTIGHSLSLGHSDASLVIAESASLADACATALGNRVHRAQDIEPALEWVLSIPGIAGALVIIGDQLGVQGDIELISLG